MGQNIDRALQAAQAIRLVVLDVDGVLSDGRLYYGEDGGELKAFHIRDGLGIKLLQRNAIQVAIITGRTSQLLARRARELGIELVIQGRDDKLTALQELLTDHPYPLEQIAYMGDDLQDLRAIRAVGLGMTVADAHPVVAAHALWQATRAGGRGAVREAAEFILQAQNKLAPTIADYL